MEKGRRRFTVHCKRLVRHCIRSYELRLKSFPRQPPTLRRETTPEIRRDQAGTSVIRPTVMPVMTVALPSLKSRPGGTSRTHATRW